MMPPPQQAPMMMTPPLPPSSSSLMSSGYYPQQQQPGLSAGYGQGSYAPLPQWYQQGGGSYPYNNNNNNNSNNRRSSGGSSGSGGRLDSNGNSNNYNNNSSRYNNNSNRSAAGGNSVLGQQNGSNASSNSNSLKNEPGGATAAAGVAGEPSPVLHLRNVTPEVSQLSIENTFRTFSKIRNVVMLRQKCQALVEMASTEAALFVMEFFKEPGYVEIDGRQVHLSFSRHRELTAQQRTSKTLLVSMHFTTSSSGGGPGSAAFSFPSPPPIAITPGIVYQIFGPFGTVERIVVLPRNSSNTNTNNRVQALIQFDNEETSGKIESKLQGQPITIGGGATTPPVSFTLNIQYSRMDEIRATAPKTATTAKPAVTAAAAAAAAETTTEEEQERDTAVAAEATPTTVDSTISAGDEKRQRDEDVQQPE